jgi:glycosyltransferase involved in cell wall biosynthesis
MKIGIYNGYVAPNAVGGSEYYTAVLAEALVRSHAVEVIHHTPGFTVQRLAEFSDTNLEGVGLRLVPFTEYAGGSFRNPWRRFRRARDWLATVSEPYDLFINLTHFLPPFCHASQGVLMVLFPFQLPPSHPGGEQPLANQGPLWRRLDRLFDRWEWNERMASYRLKIAISEFTRKWTKRYWGIDCRLAYPPADNHFSVCPKEDLILSVGRFHVEWHTKRQAEMVSAFRELEEAGLAGWEYSCVGGLMECREADCAYFQEVCDMAAGGPVEVVANLARCQVRKLYERAKVFWHAAGYGQDESSQPALTEHFGIAVADAMAAGCVPIVINKGGLREIVQHGVNGFLWDTLEELKAYTLQVARDERSRQRLSEAARARARVFSRENSLRRFQALLSRIM